MFILAQRLELFQLIGTFSVMRCVDHGVTYDAQHCSETVFLSRKAFAVIGASVDRAKFGNRILRALLKTKKDCAIYPGQPARLSVLLNAHTKQ